MLCPHPSHCFGCLSRPSAATACRCPLLVPTDPPSDPAAQRRRRQVGLAPLHHPRSAFHPSSCLNWCMLGTCSLAACSTCCVGSPVVMRCVRKLRCMRHASGSACGLQLSPSQPQPPSFQPASVARQHRGLLMGCGARRSQGTRCSGHTTRGVSASHASVHMRVAFLQSALSPLLLLLDCMAIRYAWTTFDAALHSL